jgi:hypothetical protein
MIRSLLARTIKKERRQMVNGKAIRGGHYQPVLTHVSQCSCFVLDGVPVLRHDSTMGWKQIYRDMAFSPYKDEMAAANELHDSLMTLRLYLDGQVRFYEVLDALRHLEYVCGQPVKRATTQFSRCLHWEDESARDEVARQCLIEIGGWINRNKRHSLE